MIIAIDGACKRNGDPTCSAVGVAWIETEDGNLLFKAFFETGSTNQRGEIYGLIEALLYAVNNIKYREDVIIITDSQYLADAINKDWCFKWRDNGWTNADGQPTKNAQLWDKVCRLIMHLSNNESMIFVEWTKGHLMSYTPGNTKKALLADPTGIELNLRIAAMANIPANKVMIVNKFADERKKHDQFPLPNNVALDWVIRNTVADRLAHYIVNEFDKQIIEKEEGETQN